MEIVMGHKNHLHNKQGAVVNGLNDADISELKVIIEKLKTLPSQTNPEGQALVASLEAWCQKMSVRCKEWAVDKNKDGVVDEGVYDPLDEDGNPDVDDLGRPVLPKK
jgi:hypothetical protein